MRIVYQKHRLSYYMWKVITWITSIFDIELDQLNWLASFQVPKFSDLSKK